MFPLRASKRHVLPLAMALLGGTLQAQEAVLEAPPDYAQPLIAASAEKVAGAWVQWSQAVKGLEERAFQLPMADARLLVQQALAAYLDFLDSRRTYNQALSTHIEKQRAAAPRGEPVVTQSAVYQDQVVLLGVNLNMLQSKLEALRNSADWVAMRRNVRPERDEVGKLQDLRRSQIPPDFSFGNSAPAPVISPLAYLDSESQVSAALRKLWTRYYQLLIDSVEQRPSGSSPLVPVRAGAGGSLAGAQARPPSSQNPMTGVWTYLEGSQEFNGVGEPRRVILEFWMENGELLGRYRAVLPDYAGDRNVDLRLRVPPGSAGGTLTLEFESKDPEAKGQLVIERLTGAADLMLVRPAGTQSPIPRGRELLHRR